MTASAFTLRTAFRKARCRRARGLSLFGVLMALGLAAIAVVGTIGLYNMTTEVQARNESQALITSLVVATQRIHQGASGYGTARLEPVLDARGAIPANAKTASTGNNRIRHAFGGRVVMTGAGQRFTIELQDLQQENCTQLLDPYVGQARSAGGLYEVTDGTTTSSLPMSVADVATICADPNDNDIELTFE